MACKSGQCKGFENLASLIGAGAKYKKLRTVAWRDIHNSGLTIAGAGSRWRPDNEYPVRFPLELGVLA